MDPQVIYVLVIVAIALVFDFSNGFNDAANSVATVVATRVLTPRKAVVWAAFFNFVAAFGFGTHVARTMGTGLVHPGVVDAHLILSTLIAAIIWTVICTEKGMPISVSHALIGALGGAAIVKSGVHALIWSTIGKIAIFIVLSPLIGLVIGWVMMVATMWIGTWVTHVFKGVTPRGIDRVFRVLQLFSAAVYSLSHGLNDAQKTMGIIFALLMSVPALKGWATHGHGGGDQIAWWIILSCQAAIALGTYTGGWKVVKTLGHRVTKLQPMGGFCAETGGGATILVLSSFGIPVSTTHTITGAIFGVGITARRGGVRWSVGTEIVTAWVLTLPCSALMAAGIFYVLSRFVY
jgi:inorganic phosphate transporter, PiT family